MIRMGDIDTFNWSLEPEKKHRHYIFYTENKVYAVANPALWMDIASPLYLLQYMKFRNYDYLFSANGSHYFKIEREDK